MSENENSSENGQKQDERNVISYLTEHPRPSDDEFHDYAESLGKEPDDLEETAYRLLGDFFGEGRWNKKDRPSLPQDEIEKGLKIEEEHTSNPLIAKRITQDHLTEFKDYNTRLDKMEEDAKKEKQAMQKLAALALSNYLLVKRAAEQEEKKKETSGYPREQPTYQRRGSNPNAESLPGQPPPMFMRRGMGVPPGYFRSEFDFDRQPVAYPMPKGTPDKDPLKHLAVAELMRQQTPSYRLPLTLAGAVTPGVAATMASEKFPNFAAGLGSIGPLVGGLGGWALGNYLREQAVQEKMHQLGY